MINFICLFLITQWTPSRAHAQAQAAPAFGPEGRESSLREIHDPDHWMAVVGDSGTTGAASDPRLSANLFTLLGRAGAIGLGQKIRYEPSSDVPMPTRVLYSNREFREAAEKGGAAELNAEAVKKSAIDQPENTFGYFVGRELGITPEDIVMVGQDGKRVKTIPTQLERIYEMATATLPPLVLLSYTANDFCDLSVFSDTLSARVDEFRQSLGAAWEKSAPFLIAHPRGTRFVVLAPLEVANVLTNEDILNQQVPLGMYGTVSCREMRSGEIEGAPVASKIAKALQVMCPAVLGTKTTDVERLQRLRDVQNAFNEVWKAQVEMLNRRYARQGITWEYLESVRSVRFGTGDVANECFHPSAAGHSKLATEVLSVIDRSKFSETLH